MNNLIKIGISEDTINTINANYGIYTLEDLNDSYLNVYKIINTFKELKINDEVITELLENSVNIFLMDYDIVLSKLKDKDLKIVADRINSNFIEAEKILYEE